jgi:2-amino-4-hydroxy-6-hydroxymethyldihydropteridine diphosphokinase
MPSGPVSSAAESAFWDEAVILALGGNLGWRGGSSLALLEAALTRLEPHGLKPIQCSSWWRSAAWPDPTEPDYINAVAIVETGLSPQGALAVLHQIEAQFGRARHERNAARTLDLDLVAYGRLTLDEPGLVLPHPRATERLFVMGPLAEIAPGWRHPVSGETAAALAACAGVGRDAAPI